MKELLASKANDNVFLVNENGIYMSKGKVVNGESVGVGRVSSSVSGSSHGGVRSKSYNVEKLSINEKKITRENWRFLDKTEQQKIRDGFFNDKVTNKEWNKPQHKIGGRRAWQNADQKNIYYTKDGRHNDVEVWQVSGKKAEHLGSMEPVEGTMYKEPNHPSERFE